ncbi:MAG: serine hydrolase [Variovorax sp.]
MHRPAMWCRLLAVSLLLLLSGEAARSADWRVSLRQEIERIDRASPGSLGVYVKRLDDDTVLSHGADRMWYLGSTVKVVVAIAVLQEVDAGRLKLADTLVLQETDRIEAGPLVRERVGRKITIDELLKRMLGDSDNTAANMLIRAVGDERLQATAKAAMGERALRQLTSLAQVRFDVYAEIHPDARKLSNGRLVEIAAAPLGPKRVEALRQALDVPRSSLKAKTIDEAYARYYEKQLNAATLEGYGDMLEKLVKGKLLKPASNERLFTDMKIRIFTNYRLQAGLPRSVSFIHKTGTQYRRACHAGVINPQDGGAHAIVVATCAADIDEQHDAGKVFEQVGRAISRTLLAEQAAAR